jgi:hypothetical protein
MKHLDALRAVEAAERGPDEGQRDHLAACRRCRQMVDGLRRILGVLAASGAPLAEPPQGLMRWAQAYARTAGTARPRLQVLEFLAGGNHAVAAVRGQAEPARAVLYGDDAHHLDLRIEADRRGSARLHGQVVPLDSSEPERWLVSVVTPGGEVHSATTDTAGEFWIEDLSSWRNLSLVAEGEGQRLVVPRLDTEERDIEEE